MLGVHGGPPGPSVNEGTGGEDDEVVQHRDGLPAIHLRTSSVDDRDQPQFLVAASDGTVDLSTSHPNYPITDNTQNTS